MQTESLALSTDQQAVADQVANYVQDLTHAGNELALGGYAGTGKSTVLGYLRSTGTLPTGTVYLAPTGKAAHVLRSKGLAASTIHSFLYLYQGLVEETDDDGDPTGKLKPVFADKDTHDDVELIVVDEASMVNDKLYDDLCALSCPILWVGDHGQLAPVGGDPGIMRDPRLRLEQVHRQAQGSDILAIAHDVRQTGNARKWIGHDTSDLFVGRPSGRRVNSHKVVDYACASEVDQIVVPFNNLRHEINATYRNRLGHDTDALVVGDRVVCMANAHKHSVFNGQTFKVAAILPTEPHDEPGVLRVTLDSLDDDRTVRNVPLSSNMLGTNLTPDNMPAPNSCHFDYAYAITCHKSQGSQWDHVLVVDIPFSKWDHKRWQYTAYTRAARKLSVVAQ